MQGCSHLAPDLTLIVPKIVEQAPSAIPPPTHGDSLATFRASNNKPENIFRTLKAIIKIKDEKSNLKCV